MKITASERKGRPGTWEAKGIDPTTGKRKSYYGKSAQDAEANARASYGFVPITPTVDPDSLYGFYSTVYLPTIAGRSENWQNQVGWAMDGYVLPEFGHRKMAELKRQEFQLFFNKLKMKVSSRRKVKIVISGVMNLAEDDELIAKNPVRRVRLPRADPSDRKALTFEQLRHLYQNCQPRAIPIVLLGGCCGLRPGEACAPSWAEFDGLMFRLRYQIRQPRGGAERTTQLKTPWSKRDIPLPQALFDALKGANQVSSIYVASNCDGGYMLPTNGTREFNEAMQRAGLGSYEEKTSKKGKVRTVFVPLICPQELRHTFTSLMENELEAPPAIVACLTGHKYEGPNAGYSHTHRRQLEKWMNRFWEQMTTSSVVQTLSHTA